MGIETLAIEEIELIHDLLAKDFAASNDPIYPAGVRSPDLLASAVGRQHTANGTILKYPDPRANAAALAYGLCCNHPFHNGNKRTALVAMLVHLDRNHFLFRDVGQKDLFDLILAVAKHEMAPKKDGRQDVDAEVISLQSWIMKKATRVERWERPITGRELRKILRRFGLELENPNSNTIDVVRYEEVAGRWPWSQPRRQVVRICKIGWHNEGSPVAPRDIRQLRRLAGIAEEHGVDARSFYDAEAVVDAFINQHRTLLRRLARR